MLAEAGTPETYQPLSLPPSDIPAVADIDIAPQADPDWFPPPVVGQDNGYINNNGVINNNNLGIVTYSDYVNGAICSIPKSWQDEPNDNMLLTVYSFIKTFVSGTGAGQTSIDNRIEQAMDLVKSHLMNAVRSEVEELKDKINKLEDTISHLSKENEILRSRASPETLQVLTDRGLSLPGSGVQPPDPAKPPLQQH